MATSGLESTSSKPQVGFIGLGAMGFGMATQLVSSGYAVKGFDVYAPQVEKFKGQGGLTSSSPKDAASASKVLVIMVATAPQVHGALFDGPDAAIHGLEPDSLIILCSTVSPNDVTEFRKLIPENIHFIDAPVSGGAVRAADGTLTILASGSEQDIALGKPYLEVMAGKETLHIIPGKNAAGEIHEIGNGMKAKTVHQTLAGIHITMTAESLAFAAALGLNVREFVDHISSPSSPGSSWMFRNRSAHLMSGDKSIRSALNIIVKDMGIVNSVGRKEGIPLFLSSTTEQVLNHGVLSNYGLEDDAYLYRIYSPSPLSATQESTKTSPYLPQLEKMLRSVHIAATAEALNFSTHLGLSGQNLYHIVEGAAGASTAFIDFAPAMLDRDFSVNGKTLSVNEVIGDLEVVVELASKMKFPLYLTATALQMFQSIKAKGWGEESVASVVKFWE